MEIFRFDEEVSIPISEFGSAFRVGPLTGINSRVQVQIMHVGAGGLIGRHPAASRQLFAVVAGSGWVAGGDGRRRPIPRGYAALWEPDEQHEAGSDDGLTAVCIHGRFAVSAPA